MTRKKLLLSLCCLYGMMPLQAADDVTVTLSAGNRAATLRNGIVSIYIGKTGNVESCLLKGETEAQDLQLINTAQKQAFYFSSNQPDYAELEAGATTVVQNTADMAEVTFSQTSATGIKWTQGYILRRGDSGYYTYLVAEGVGDNSLGEARVVYRLDDAKFRYGYVNSQMQGTMPTADEMTRSEAREVQDATFTLDDGTIYTKYNWANYVKDDHFHGVIDETDGVGAWTIPVSTEYVNGGPMRQDLTVHATDKGPLILQMLHGTHFGASSQVFAEGTKKVYGPFFFYINKGTRGELIADAAAKAAALEAEWPFAWFSHTLYPTTRSTVSGQIVVNSDYDASPLRVVLSQTAEPYDEGDGFVFWADTDADGTFAIENVRPGTYVLTAYALCGGNTSQFTRAGVVVGGSPTDLGCMVWKPERFGTEVFRIGESNRLSDGFCLSDAARAYELYQSVPADLTFTVGQSSEASDWYYAQTKVGTWTIKFSVADPNHPFRLTASAAGAANVTRINVYVNGTERANNTWTYSSDGSVYRSGVQSGRFQQHVLHLPAGSLRAGENTIALELSDHNYATSGIAGVMWDCIKLEMDEHVEAYDFTNRGTSGGLLPDWGSNITAGGQTLQMLALGSETFGGRFACGPKRGDDNVFKFRDSGSYHGLYSLYSNRYLSVLDLEQGDRVTITMNADRTALSFRGEPIVSDAAAGNALENGKTYTVATDGHLNLVTTGETYIERIDIQHSTPTQYVTVEVGKTVAGDPDLLIDGTTLVSAEALDFTGLPVRAYVATRAEAGVVTFTPVERVPAATPLFLKSTGNPVTIDVPVLDDDAATADDGFPSVNLLHGSPTRSTLLQSDSNTRYYVYGVLHGEAGFYPVSTSDPLTSAAGKAWLQLTDEEAQSAARLAITFTDSEVTGVSEVRGVKSEGCATAVYDLQGRRISAETASPFTPHSSLKNGLYIVRGKTRYALGSSKTRYALGSSKKVFIK